MKSHDHSAGHGHGSLHPHGVEEPLAPKEGVTPLVDITDVSSGYAGSPAIENVSLKIWPGQFIAVVGPNGGGKTTLLRTILGAVPLMRGRVAIRGETVGGAALQRVGYVPQLETIDWNFPITVEEVLLMGLFRKNHWLKRIKKEDLKKIDALLDRLNLTGLGKRHIRELSGGQQQAVFLGRALLGEPDLILLDEPTAGLDIRSRDDVIHFLHEINHQGVAIVITAHDLNWVAAHLPWVVCLNRRVIAEGKPQEVFTSAVLQETYRGDMVVFLHDGMVMIGERPHAPAP
ncbi:MAG TPA: metal ABC transporter ATP-binding protein [Candidatus Acidoferrales bacterium]|jgi:ABC-type Mn2+/Zn2+ transport system ATPase subunit|nr:metal ABC transporter ATP-binding protein [Candidatus Acidoferrales bacterium]